MSVLEIVLYSLLGVGFVIWTSVNIYKTVKDKDKKKNEEED